MFIESMINKITLPITVMMFFLFMMNSHAVILSKSEVEQADISLLQNESAVFQSIGMGIALSLAQCEGVDLCTVDVDVEEIEELLKALDVRINTLTLKQETAEDPAQFEQVLTTYVNTRDDYGAQLEKLKTIKSDLDAEEGFLDDTSALEPDFPVETARDMELREYLEEELELFEDDELEDEESEWDLPELPEELQ